MSVCSCDEALESRIRVALPHNKKGLIAPIRLFSRKQLLAANEDGRRSDSPDILPEWADFP